MSLDSPCRVSANPIVQAVVLWNTKDLGYLTTYASVLAAQSKLDAGAQSVVGGRLGALQVRGREIILGDPLIINKANIDRFDF